MDGRTDRQDGFSSLDRVCISCSAVTIAQLSQRDPPSVIFARIVANKCLTILSLTVFTQRKFSRLCSSEVRFYYEIGRVAFLSSPLGDIWATYDDHLRLVGKRVLDFLLVLIGLFSLGRTAEALYE